MEQPSRLIFEAPQCDEPKDKFTFPQVSYSMGDFTYSVNPFNQVDSEAQGMNTANNLDFTVKVVGDGEDQWVKKMEESFKSCPGPNFIDSLHDICSLDFSHSDNPFYESEMPEAHFYNEGSSATHDDCKPEMSYNKLSQKTVCNSDSHAAKPADTLYAYIEDVIEQGIRAPKVRAGRPKQEFDTSYESILAYYDYYVSSLQHLIEQNYSMKRSDTFRNTIFSYLKKLPIKLREKSCSVSEPKSKKLAIFLDAFLTPFVTCFKDYFKLGAQAGVSKIELFLYFMCISYPEDKCTQILEKLYQEDSISQALLKKIKLTLKARKGKSKKDITLFINMNPCFQIYSQQVLNRLDMNRFDEQAKLMVNDFLLTNTE